MKGSGAGSGPAQILTDPDPGSGSERPHNRGRCFSPLYPATATEIKTDPDPEHWQRIPYLKV